MPDNSGGGGIKNTSQEILDAITSDGNAFRGSNIDAKVSNAGVEPDIVRYETSPTVDLNFYFSQPPHTSIGTTGEASITFGEEGAVVGDSFTSGDEAFIGTGSATNPQHGGITIIRMIFSISDPVNYGDDCILGYVTDFSDDFGTVGLDLTNSQVKAKGVTQSVSLNGNGGFYDMIIKVDHELNETTFFLANEFNEDVVTINEDMNSVVGGRCVYMKSNGNGDLVKIHTYQRFELPLSTSRR